MHEQPYQEEPKTSRSSIILWLTAVIFLAITLIYISYAQFTGEIPQIIPYIPIAPSFFVS